MEETESKKFIWGSKSPINDYCRLFALTISPDDKTFREHAFYAKKLEMLCSSPKLQAIQAEKHEFKDIKKFKKYCMNAEFMSEYYRRMANARAVGICTKYFINSLAHNANKNLEKFNIEAGKDKAFHIFNRRFKEKAANDELQLNYGGTSPSTMKKHWGTYKDLAHIIAAWVSVTKRAKIRKKYSFERQLKAIQLLSENYLEWCSFTPERQNKYKAQPFLKKNEAYSMIEKFTDSIPTINKRNPLPILNKVNKLYKANILLEALEDFKSN